MRRVEMKTTQGERGAGGSRGKGRRIIDCEEGVDKMDIVPPGICKVRGERRKKGGEDGGRRQSLLAGVCVCENEVRTGERESEGSMMRERRVC